MLVKLIDLDKLDEYKEVIEGLILGKRVQAHLKDAEDKTDEIYHKVQTFYILHCNFLSFRYDNSLSDDAGVERKYDIQQQQSN